jgi:hypothetical protein
MNVEIGTEDIIPFLGIFVSNYRYCVFAVSSYWSMNTFFVFAEQKSRKNAVNMRTTGSRGIFISYLMYQMHILCTLMRALLNFDQPNKNLTKLYYY